MELHRHEQLMACLRETYLQQSLQVTFTQWDGDEEDEQVSQFQASLVDIVLDDNEFGTKDLLLTFELDEEEVVEILMELSREEADLANLDGGTLRLFGTEAELVLTRHS
ncbi:hypothetical protein LOK74_11555 [Brevibacillus humidisoli]|uniref:hypothetical protein n=1 Tax=Brevibacillus humidisoli TaxID=2895522 RepID=UPI001E29AFAF|nr:hypothetical protein [Brevibacillus humidisoli]UFJ43075.1 hypothetical protein LOK74_11555 [Brevibacillus humidisoli]